MKNVGYIMDRGYENISSIAVYDWKTDLFKLQEFFEREDVPRLGIVTLANPDMGCRYYDQFSEEDFEDFIKLHEGAKRYYFENLMGSNGKNFFDQMFGEHASRVLFNHDVLIGRNPIMPYTASCVPGRKIYVDVDGRFHTCERVNATFPIGDVNKGLDFERISEMMRNFFRHLDICSNRKIKRMCSDCYCAFLTLTPTN